MSHTSSPLSDRTAPLFLRLVTPAWRLKKPAKLGPADSSVFILSTGRTGTVYISDILTQLDDVHSVHEPKPSRVLNAWTTAFLMGAVSVPAMASVLGVARQKSLKNIQGKRIYVESNNFIAGFADALPHVFDNETVIHIVRDPRDFITSLTNRGDDKGIRRWFNRYVPFWAYVPKGSSKKQLNALTRATHRWVAINHYLSDYGTRNPDSYHLFMFEAVFAKKQPSAALKKLFKACGLTANDLARLDYDAKPRAHASRFSLLDPPGDANNASKHAHMAKWKDWSPAEAQAVHDICGPLMKKYGYGHEPEWQAKLSNS